jgi:glycosyltransferase involved in cell wall biosynthesis
MSLHNYRLLCLPGTFLRDGKVCEACLGRVPWRGVVHGCYRGSATASGAIAGSLGLHRAVRTFGRINLYLAVSRFVGVKHIEAGFPPERIRTKPNFAWPVPRRHGAGEYFLYVGRLSAEKGISTLLEASRRSGQRLIIVGDGPEAGSLTSAAPPTVEFEGLTEASDVAKLVRGARALLVPSVGYEGAGRVVLEAYAAGVPVVASRIGGLPEAVEDGFSGLLLPPADALAWAAAMERLLDDEESERLGEGAWTLWNERYTPERGLAGLESAYASAGTESLSRSGGG